MFFWREAHQSVRVIGKVEKVSREEIEAYFWTRPKGSQLGAWASRQSQVVKVVIERLKKLEKRFASVEILGEVKFWCGKPSRLHDRVYLEEEGGKAKVEERVLGTLIVKWENRKDQRYGVSATKPLLEIAGVGLQQDLDPCEEGIQVAINVAEAAIRGNYLGPMIAAVSLIPILKRTSKSPSVLLISSLGAVIPAPTRTLYGSTKIKRVRLSSELAINS
ncbi:pyridoxamine 5 -phosphate oxidase [Lentinula edodes]|uniref:pyridoxal 5'-phosphate synthase n=1 Tax=Lentinula edodes TaxID=5353 RepID=A0A1Q3EJB1_LENED|nr:pyridoxamine 5 -phosphate oxidase [Lentinula edodes]